jgi:uncharacterized protein YciI
MLYVVLLKFSDNRDQVSQHLDGHKAWIKQGFDDAMFLVAGSLQPQLGGAIVAHNTTADDLARRVDEDPFVAEKVVTAEILEIAPAIACEQLQFLLENQAG